MTHRVLRILRLLGAASILAAASIALLAVLAGPASAHVGPHDPTAGSTLRTDLGGDDGCAKAPGSVCTKFKISNCQGADTELTGFYARANPPAGVPVRGMVVVFSGGAGTSYWQGQAIAGSEEDKAIDEFFSDLRAGGMVTIQVKWGDDWLVADNGNNDGLHMACRPARILKYLHDVRWEAIDAVPNATGACGFCVMGPSGGASATAWSLTHFKTESYVDGVFPTGGPPHAAMAKGCAPSGPAEDPYSYGTGSSIRQIDNPFKASPNLECAERDASYRSVWDTHSIDTPKSMGDHHHPTTRVHLIDGAMDPLRLHGYDWMLRMWEEPSPNPYTTFELVPGMNHGISENPSAHDGMDRLTSAILLTDTSKFRACSNGLDDDWDGLVDMADAGCASPNDASEKSPVTACDNGLDDDGDGYVDFRTEFGDPECSSPSQTTESGGGEGPTISIADVTVGETNSRRFKALFPVTLSAQSATPVTVQYQTQNDTATAPSDFVAVSPTTLTFAPGETLKSIPVTIKGDTVVEPDEQFFVVLSAPGGATISGDGIGVGTILNDDSASMPTLAVSDVAAVEGSPAAFQVTLTGTSPQTVSVAYATADGTAVEPGDYSATGGTLTWLPGTSGTKTVGVPVLDDGVDENAETFTLNLSAPANATVTDGQGVATIAAQTSGPTISIADAEVVEGTSTTTTTLKFIVSLSAPSAQDVSFSFTTADGTAIAPGDYTARNVRLVIIAGRTTRVAAVQVQADSVDEADETFFGSISKVTNATVGNGTATGAILDDDPPAGRFPA